MAQIKSSLNRPLKICYWNSEKRFAGTQKSTLENYLKLLSPELNLTLVDTSDQIEALLPLDLLIVSADHVADDAFSKWVGNLQSKLVRQNGVWIPAIFLANIKFDALLEMLKSTYQSNFYFDVISGNHLESLPLRVANLLRIHDHIHEIGRFEQQYNSLQDVVKKLENEIKSLKGQK
jgi:hypothetical protein